MNPSSHALSVRNKDAFKARHPSVESVVLWPDGIVEVIYFYAHDDAQAARDELLAQYDLVQDEEFFGYNVLTLRRRA